MFATPVSECGALHAVPVTLMQVYREGEGNPSPVRHMLEGDTLDRVINHKLRYRYGFHGSVIQTCESRMGS
jgi:hypothetical protein